MPTPTRPNSYPIWTQGNTGVRQQPTNGEQFAGFVPNFRPPAGWHNWLFGIASDWIAWLDYATQGNGPVSNVGHNILTDTTIQGQFDQTDAFLSSLGLERLVASPTINPLVWTLNKSPLNQSTPVVFVGGTDWDNSQVAFSVISSVPTLTFTSGNAPAAGQSVIVYGLTANNPGTGGASVSGGYVAYGSGGSGVLVTAGAGVTSTADQRALIFTVSAGGITPITHNPQISPGTKIGQELRLVGTSDADAISLATGNGLLINGPIILQNGVSLDLYWNGAVWAESDRSN